MKDFKEIIIIENQKLPCIEVHIAVRGNAIMLLKIHTYDLAIKLLDSKTSLIIPPANEENNPPQANDAAFQTAYWSLNPGYTFRK